jgi:hypothetical protein
MRNKLITAAAIILLLLFSFIGWLEYRQYSSWNVPVHAHAQTVIRINTDALIKSYIKEYGLDFSRKMKGKPSEKKDSAANTGVYFPGNIFIYNISSALPSTFFCTLPVYNLSDFKLHIKSRFNIQLADSAGLSFGKTPDGKITVACSAAYISIAYSPKKEEVLPMLKDILSGKNTLSQKDLLTRKLKTAVSHIAAANSHSFFTLNINGKKILMHAESDSFASITVPFETKHSIAGKAANASFTANVFPQVSLFKQQYQVKQFTIETDSILKYYDGYAGIEIGQPVSQMDTITTYEYDDNFEKAEKQTVTEVKVPSIILSILAEPGMLNYLQKQQIVTAQMKLNKELFPLYAVTVTQSKQMLHFSTNSLNEQQAKTLTGTPHFLEVNMDVKKMVDALDIPYLQQYIKNMNGLHLMGEGRGPFILEGSIDFEISAMKEIMNLLKK